MQVLVHDYETTGVNSKRCGVVQSAIWIAEFAEDGTYEVIVQEVAKHNPGRPIPSQASDVHGIMSHHVEHLPIFTESLGETFKQVHEEFAPVAVLGYNNTGFDDVIAGRCGLDTSKMNVIDMILPARAMKKAGLLENAKLVTAYSTLTGDTDTDKAHDAEFDLHMTCALIPHVMEFYGVSTLSEMITKMNTRIVDVDMPMPFGKHEGLELSEVPKGYRRWLMKDPARLEPDLRASLEALHKMEAES